MKKVTIAFLALGALWMAPTAVSAQSCGVGCNPCALWGAEAIIYASGGPLSMTCRYAPTGSCQHCDENTDVLSVPAETVAEAVRLVSVPDVEALMLAYGARLYLAEERGMLAVVGTSCDPDALGATLVLTTPIMDELRRLGIQPLSSLASRTDDK